MAGGGDCGRNVSFGRGGTRGQEHQWNEIECFHRLGVVVGLPVGFFGDAHAAERGVGAVNGLQDVKVKLFARRHADIEPVLLNRVQNLLRVGLQHGLRALQTARC